MSDLGQLDSAPEYNRLGGRHLFADHLTQTLKNCMSQIGPGVSPGAVVRVEVFPHTRETIALCAPPGMGWSSLDEKPASRNNFSYSGKV